MHVLRYSSNERDQDLEADTKEQCDRDESMKDKSDFED